jgi:adenosylmethionine-8-amino-7-oxononanoate aminotransferase
LPFDALGVVRTEAAHFYRYGQPGESEVEYATRLANNLEQLILREDPQTIAAFLAEPVSGAGGVLVPPATYWEKIQAVLRKYDILLIDDEVITGFGRTGNDFGARTFDMRPQMMTLAKAVTSGYLPLSVAVISGDLYEPFAAASEKVGTFGHGYTYSGHPVSCAVALKTLEIYSRERIFEHAARVGTYLQRRLRELASHPLVGDVRGVGLIAGLELVANKLTRQPFQGTRVGQHAQYCAQQRGLIVRALPGNTIAICPPLVITEPQVDELVDALRLALNDALDYTRQERLLTG